MFDQQATLRANYPSYLWPSDKSQMAEKSLQTGLNKGTPRYVRITKKTK